MDGANEGGPEISGGVTENDGGPFGVGSVRSNTGGGLSPGRTAGGALGSAGTGSGGPKPAETAASGNKRVSPTIKIRVSTWILLEKMVSREWWLGAVCVGID
jgi:hypothetical protein